MSPPLSSAPLSSATCQQALDGVGSGVAASLQAVDCAANATAQAAFGRLFAGDAQGGGGALLPALTILLTLYVAFFAFSLITGRSSLRVSALTPRMLTVGMVLTFATSWIAYQGVMWNLAVGAPNQIAGILMGTSGSSTQIFAEKIDVAFAALIQASSQPGAAEAGQAAGQAAQQAASQAASSTFSPPGLLWLGATLLLLGTVGVLATCKIALAVLLAIGPVFVVLALFNGTRGLFTGWLKGVVMLAVTPLFTVLGGSLMLELAVPVIRAIGQVPGKIDPRAAMAFFMIGAVHAALMVMMLKVAGTMVAGWSVFGLAGARGAADGMGGKRGSAGGANRTAAAAPVIAAPAAAADARSAAAAPSREIRLAQAAPLAANDTGPAAGSVRRETMVLPGTASSAAANASLSRTRGVGSRFRAPAPPALARSLETTR